MRSDFDNIIYLGYNNSYKQTGKGDLMGKNKYVYENNNYIVNFEDSVNDFHSVKENERVSKAVKIKVFKKDSNNKLTSLYVKECDVNETLNQTNAFIKKFLEDVEFRNDFLIDGENFTDKILFTDDTGVNKKCREAINKFNKIKDSNKKFKDFVSLKTYGLDKYSRMKINDIFSLVSDYEIEFVKSEFIEEKHILNALRWRLRGLSLSDAVRKVKTDIEVANNCKY